MKTGFLENSALAPCRKQVALTKSDGNDDCKFYPLKQGALLLRPEKLTKMTKMAGVTQAEPPFARNIDFWSKLSVALNRDWCGVKAQYLSEDSLTCNT